MVGVALGGGGDVGVAAAEGAREAVAAGRVGDSGIGVGVMDGSAAVAVAGTGEGVTLGVEVRVIVAVSITGVAEGARTVSIPAISVAVPPPLQLASSTRKAPSSIIIQNALFKASPPMRLCRSAYITLN